MGVALAGMLTAQAPARLAREAPFLKDPAGTRLATLAAGVRLTPSRTAGGYAEVTIQGWLFTASTRADKREGFDLSVSASGGENLRLEPDGAVFGRAVEGALFSRVAIRGRWTRVRRTGWVPRSAFPSPPAPLATRPAPARAARDSAAARPRPDFPAAGLAESTVVALRGRLRTGAAIRTAPEGAPMATTPAGAEIDIGPREGDWVKVRMDGWVRRIDIEGAITPKPAITAAMLRDNPDRYVGQTVDWRLQFLAHQQADELRSEMPLGHPYLLMRGPLPESGFVYVLLSKEQADRLQGLKPLDELSMMVTVRAGRTRFLATPVVELARLSSGESKTP